MAKLTSFIQAFRTPDLRNKLLFTLGIIVLFRFGSTLPVPGISERDVQHCSGLSSGGGGAAANVYAVLNVFSGNSLLHVTVFALGIMPYVTASIILQLLTQAIPRLQALKDEGRAGQAKITQYSRYLTVLLAVMVSAGYVQLARTGRLFPGSDCSRRETGHRRPLPGLARAARLRPGRRRGRPPHRRGAAPGRDLVIGASGLSQAALVSLVSVGLSAA